MSTSNIAEETPAVVNGVDVGQVMNIIEETETDATYAQFQFRATNQWMSGGHSRSRIKEFYAGKAEDETRTEPFMLEADEPKITAGLDQAPNSMEFVLHALATCLTGTLVYHAAVRGIDIESVESSYEGNMDVRGLLGLSEDVRKGFNKVTVNMRVKSKASSEELTELALYSPVYDIVSNSLPVEFKLVSC
jgi:uncharacterized OsmC-like protein